MKKRFRTIFVLLLFSIFFPTGLHAQENAASAAEHEKLRALRGSFTTALNAQDFAGLKALVTEDLQFTTISNEHINGVAELETYWKRLFDGDVSEMTGLQVAPEADDLTTFLGGDAGVVQGSSQDIYSFRKMGDREMTSRWTAVVKKVGDDWKVSHVHMSGSVLNNPVLDATATVGTIKTVIGFVIGFLIAALVFRRRKA